jgi:protein-tyrosine sulfotransferase
MSSSAPIFILSCERSGSTLLRYILDTHPALCCPGELYLGQLIKDLRITISRTTALAAAKESAELDAATQREVHRILDDLLSGFTRARGKRVWCDKTPANLKSMADIEWAFPEARFICLYRNSWDVVQSCVETRQKGMVYTWATPYAVQHLHNFVAAMLESWVEKTQIALNVENFYPQMSYRIKYENLVQNPAGVLEPLFKFLELDWDPSLLDRVFQVEHDKGGGDFKIESTHQIEKDRIGQGVKLDPGLLALVPSGLKDRQRTLNQQLGYIA